MMEPEDTAVDTEDQQQQVLQRSASKRSAPKCNEFNPVKRQMVFPETPWAMLNADCIKLIARELSTEDLLSLASAYPETAVSQEVMGHPSSVLARQKALYLLMDSYGYSQQDEYYLWGLVAHMLDQFPLADFQGDENQFAVSRDRMRQIGFANLQGTFPKVTTLRLLLRKFSAKWLADMIRILRMFSDQLISLQIIIWHRGRLNCVGDNHVLPLAVYHSLLALLNTPGQFPALSHLSLAININVCTEFQIEQNLSLSNLLGQLNECFLHLPRPDNFLEKHFGVMEANQGLIKFGLTRYSSYFGTWSALANFSDQIAAKIAYINYAYLCLSQCPQMATRIQHFTLLTFLDFSVSVTATSNLYAQMLASLQGLPNMKRLTISLDYHNHFAFHQDNFQLIRLPAIEELWLGIRLNRDAPPSEDKRINHDILRVLALRQQFTGLKLLSLCVRGRCSICNCQLHSYSNLECYAKMVEPVKGFDQLEVFERTWVVKQEFRYAAMLSIDKRILQTIKDRRNGVVAAAYDEQNSMPPMPPMPPLRRSIRLAKRAKHIADG